MEANQRTRLVVALAIAALFSSAGFFAARTAEAHEAHHGHHAAAAGRASDPQKLGAVKVPPVRLVRQDGRQVALGEELDTHGPVLLAFIYTSCTAVCPVTSQVLAKVQEKLGENRDGVRIISVSIDPDFDTPARLRDYAKTFGAGPAWQHYTGSRRDSVAVQKAFRAYYGDKMNHQPALFVRQAHSDQWSRIDGFPAADMVVGELGSGRLSR